MGGRHPTRLRGVDCGLVQARVWCALRCMPQVSACSTEGHNPDHTRCRTLRCYGQGRGVEMEEVVEVVLLLSVVVALLVDVVDFDAFFEFSIT